ncbi:hypothetical protein EJB05_14557 [Eragrostis curvula]|uniref:Uncharacterized protein n=1 Tax=Eragrostis curvula TaxID=38414 RepID=A0A5J9VZL5_9POAL|nr:hypothetical protein EJB05_14557 [Eragrostis curvula]
MAMRYLARKVGVPSLRRASGPRVSPAAGSRSLTSNTSQGVRSNGTGVSAGKKFPDIAKLKAEIAAEKEALKKSIRDEKIDRLVTVGSGAAGLGIGLMMVGYMRYEQRKLIREAKFSS